MARIINSWDEVGMRLADARKAVGLTQADLGERVGLDRTAINKIEQGRRGVDSLELAKIAAALSRPVDWFVIPSPPAVVSRRTKLDVAGERREDLELELWARDAQLLVDLGLLDLADPPRPGGGIDTVAKAEAAAAFVRRALALPDEPLRDLSAVADRMGLLVLCVPLNDDVTDGSYVALDRGGVTLINGLAPAGRRRFTLAHEIGHHVFADSYSAEWLVGEGRDDRERLINAFAINLLAPREVVLSLWHRHFAGDKRLAAIALAAELGLSWTAMCGHLANLKLLDSTDYALLRAAKPSRADYLELPVAIYEDLRPPFVSRAFAGAVLKGYRQGKLAGARTVALLRFTIEETDLPVRGDVPLDAMQRELAPLDDE